MKYIGIFIVGFIAALFLTSQLEGLSISSIIQVNVINESGETVYDITITHEDGSVILNELKNGESIAVPVMIYGESSYQIKGTLENGENILGEDPSYVEPGYIIDETITSGKFIKEYKDLFGAGEP